MKPIKQLSETIDKVFEDFLEDDINTVLLVSEFWMTHLTNFCTHFMHSTQIQSYINTY